MKDEGIRYTKWLMKHAPDLSGKTALVTGANSGIGFAVACFYAHLGASVILACRNEEKAHAAIEKIKMICPTANLANVKLDLASFASIEALGASLHEKGTVIDICLHCAGVYYPRGAFTEDGYPMTEGVNYVGTTHLADVLTPLMRAGGRMIFMTSLVDRFGKPDRMPKGEGYAAYARSKTLLSADVYRRAERADGITYIAVHPGITATDLLSPAKTTHKPFFSRIGHAFLYVFTHAPDKAALTAVYALKEDIPNGTVIGPRGLFGISGYPHKTKFARRVKRTASGKVKTLLPRKVEMVEKTVRSQENEAAPHA